MLSVLFGHGNPTRSPFLFFLVQQRLWNHFSWPRDGSLSVETGVTDSKLGTVPEPSLELPRSKKGAFVTLCSEAAVNLISCAS